MLSFCYLDPERFEKELFLTVVINKEVILYFSCFILDAQKGCI